VGAEGQQAINALLSDALQPGAGQGAVLRSVSAGLQRMGLADRIEVRQLGRSSRYELLVHKDGVSANLRDVGVGVAQVLPVLTVAYSVPPGSTVLLEEPEIHLHPLAQAVLAELFAEVSQQRQVQFLVETHSEHLFRRMQTLLARRQTTTAQCQMLFVERQGANAVLVPLEVDEFGAVRNWPPRFFGDAMGEAREQARARAQRMREAAGG
jgi:predicted ATPase